MEYKGIDEKIKAVKREYNKRYYQKNKEKRKQINQRYWEKKAREREVKENEK
ncbi:MAG: hypothetical protein RSD36_16225 [Terrisporobacter sp.]